MNQKLVSLCLAAALTGAANFSHADALGLYAGVGVWQADADNNVDVEALSVDDVQLGDDNSNFAFVALEHPIPLLPNIRLQQVNIDINGSGSAAVDIDLTHQDAILYYEFLDNWVNLDLGLSARRYDGNATAITSGSRLKVDIDGVVPMIYGKAQFDLPFTGWSVGADVNATDFSGDRIADLSVKIAYESDLIPLFGLGAEVGYRHMSMELDDLDELDSELTVDGPYAAVTLHF